MAKETLDSIAKELKVSKATVSRALRHCDGVGSELRNKILAMAEDGGLIMGGECDIYCILPQVPSYFWRRAVDAVITHSGGDKRVKLNICTKSSDAETALYYLDEAGRMGARAIVISMQPTTALKERLERLAKERLVILLCEFFEAEGCYYVGGSPTDEGAAVGRLWLEKYPNIRPIILDFHENTNSVLRAAAFEQTLRQGGIVPRSLAIESSIYTDGFSTTPSKLARMLDGMIDDRQNLGVYCPLGGVDISLTLYKLKTDPAPISVCHDIDIESDICMRTSANPLGVKCSAVCMQDIRSQARAAMELASRYIKEGALPPSRRVILPPDVHITHELF